MSKYNEFEIMTSIEKASIKVRGYREVGTSFQEWQIKPIGFVDAEAMFEILKSYDFFELRLDIVEDGYLTATRTIF